MNRQEYIEIKNRAWNWYKNGMTSWILATIKDFANAPQWVKDVACYFQGNSKIDFDFVVDRDDVNLLKKYDTQIDTILRASQRLNFKVNYTKELLEFFEAERDSDEYEMIDALCDMCVVSMNAGIDYREGDIDKLLIMGTINLHSITPSNVLSDRNIGYIVAMLQLKGYDPYKCLLETIKELNTRTGAWNDQEGKWCKYLGAYTEQEARDKLLEIERIEWFILKHEDDDFWYFGQDDGVDFFENKERAIRKVKKWYKADYTKCKLG